ncbi:hypothetical protein EYC84_007077 [Monilinia fructicola]|uniref:Uncharacterized protein n=1 Tax=Monilinia fructicola TaxID=38448 RepID=A0A5M9K979_MONFR|nr:hypothetical protein EYC84_007077 [Monilinia fructicola]
MFTSPAACVQAKRTATDGGGHDLLQRPCPVDPPCLLVERHEEAQPTGCDDTYSGEGIHSVHLANLPPPISFTHLHDA